MFDSRHLDRLFDSFEVQFIREAWRETSEAILKVIERVLQNFRKPPFGIPTDEKVEHDKVYP